MFACSLQFVLATALLTMLCGCGAVHTLKPLQVGDSEAYLSLGGPLVQQGVTFPAPYTVLGLAHGYTPRVTLHADWHPSAAIYKVAVLGGGAFIGLVNERGIIPELAVDLSGLVASDFESHVFLPMATAVASYRFAESKWAWYLGLDTLFQLHRNDTPYLPHNYAPFVGLLRESNPRWSYGAELKWLGASDETRFSTLDIPRLFDNDYGDIGTYLFAAYRFGEVR